MELSRDLKENEVMISAGKWMELEMIILRDGAQTQKEKCRMFFFMCET